MKTNSEETIIITETVIHGAGSGGIEGYQMLIGAGSGNIEGWELR